MTPSFFEFQKFARVLFYFKFAIITWHIIEKEDINMSDKLKLKACRVWEYTMLETPIFASVAGAAVIGLWAYMIKKYDC